MLLTRGETWSLSLHPQLGDLLRKWGYTSPARIAIDNHTRWEFSLTQESVYLSRYTEETRCQLARATVSFSWHRKKESGFRVSSIFFLGLYFPKCLQPACIIILWKDS